MASFYPSDEQRIFIVTKAALIQCMHRLGVSKINIGEMIIRDLIEKEIGLEWSQSFSHFGWEIRCPELAKAQKENKKLQLPWDENKNESENEEIEITIEEA